MEKIKKEALDKIGVQEEVTMGTAKPKMVKVAKNIELEFNEGNKSKYIPQNYSEYKNANHILDQVAVAIGSNLPVMLIGETGTGKTSIVKYLAGITNNGFRRVNHNGGTTVDDILGKFLVNEKGTYWVDGVLTEALRNGDWYLADEINASTADILFAYHPLLEEDGYIVLPENNGEIVRPHKNFKFFGSINPTGDYHGVKELNKAFMSRFASLKVDYPSPALEQKILCERTGISDEVAKNLVKFAVEVRASHANENGTQYVLSTRDLLMWSKLFLVYNRYMPSAEMSVLNKVNEDDFNSIKDLLALHFASLDTDADNAQKITAQNNVQSTTATADKPEEFFPF